MSSCCAGQTSNGASPRVRRADLIGNAKTSELREDGETVYDKLAPIYDRLHRRWLHRRWLHRAGAEAQAALEASVRAVANETSTLLDAGCGTGAFARKLISEGTPPEMVTLLDRSEQMLSQCNDIHAQKILGRLEALPFGNFAFDIVTCAWFLETVSNIPLALSELLRVTAQNGTLLLVFCTEKPGETLTHSVLRWRVESRRTGRFLSAQEVTERIRTRGDFEVRPVPVRGPSSMLIVKRVSITF